MSWWNSRKSPKFSVVVIFHNMQREADRTLHSLTRSYQLNGDSLDYEVIAIDSNSTQFSSSEKEIKRFGNHFRYVKYTSPDPTPCAALNHGAQLAQYENLICIIDGARILSPGILNLCSQAMTLNPHAFVMTLGLHLGPKVQNLSILDGYDQTIEDALLNDTPWKENGYNLFGIASLALSSREGFFSSLSESNCFAISKQAYGQLGGFDEQFKAPGGGVVNLDFFERALKQEVTQPVMLLGEGTFHQYHGGVATNVPMKEHPWKKFAQEYKSLRGYDYMPPSYEPFYLGELSDKVRNRLSIEFS